VSGYAVKSGPDVIAWFPTVVGANYWASKSDSVAAQDAKFTSNLTFDPAVRPDWRSGYGVYPAPDADMAAWFATRHDAGTYAYWREGTGVAISDLLANFS
jgi:hypothetical protein